MLYDSRVVWQLCCMTVVLYDSRVLWQSCMLLVYYSRIVWQSCMLVVYNSRVVWQSFMTVVLYNSRVCQSCVTVVYDSHVWQSRMTVVYACRLWQSCCMTVMYDGRIVWQSCMKLSALLSRPKQGSKTFSKPAQSLPTDYLPDKPVLPGDTGVTRWHRCYQGNSRVLVLLDVASAVWCYQGNLVTEVTKVTVLTIIWL